MALQQHEGDFLKKPTAALCCQPYSSVEGQEPHTFGDWHSCLSVVVQLRRGDLLFLTGLA